LQNQIKVLEENRREIQKMVDINTESSKKLSLVRIVAVIVAICFAVQLYNNTSLSDLITKPTVIDMPTIIDKPTNITNDTVIDLEPVHPDPVKPAEPVMPAEKIKPSENQ